MARKDIITRIEEGIEKSPIIKRDHMTINEFLFVITHLAKIEDAFINIDNQTTHDFHFGFADGYWPVRIRALMVKDFGVFINQDEGQENVTITIYAKEARA